METGFADGLADSVQGKALFFVEYERMEYERSLIRRVLLLILIVDYLFCVGAADLPESQTFFNENISVIIQGKRIAFHTAGGQAQSTDLTYLTSSQTNAQQTNYATLRTSIEEDPAEGETVLENARGLNHGGGVQLPPSSAQYANMSTFIDLVNAEKNAPLDSDGDGISDAQDAFPEDPLETSDTDGDLTGNNQDLDDDNDGISDQQELLDGTDPLSILSCLNCFFWDADADTKAEALSDGLLLLRYLFVLRASH